MNMLTRSTMVLTMALAVFATTTTQAADSLAAKENASCIKACQDCVTACESCVTGCLNEDDVNSPPHTSSPRHVQGQPDPTTSKANFQQLTQTIPPSLPNFGVASNEVLRWASMPSLID